MERAITREDGFSLLEVLVAAVILALGALAAYSTLSGAVVNNQRAKATQIGLDRAQQEMELLRSLPEEKLALTQAPPSSTHTHSPNYRVSNGNFALTKGEPPSNYAVMVINGGSLYGGGEITGGTVSPGPTSFESGGVKGKVYRYIVWRNDSSCPTAECPGEQDYKQIVVAVRLTTASDESGEGGYVEVQSDFINPEKNEKSNPAPGSNGEVTSPQQFYLSNTPCASGSTERKENEANNALHNTLGTCASGLHTGSTLGAPDALLLGPPPGSETEGTKPPVYDYSEDFKGTVVAEAAKGIQMHSDTTTGCSYAQTKIESEPQWKTHRWVTDSFSKEFKMFGESTLVFYTRTLSATSYKGKICVFLFKREEAGSPPTATDTPILASGGAEYWSYTAASWPTAWTEVKVPLPLKEEKKIPKGGRLGLAVSVEKETGGEGLAILYDNFEYKARLEVDTSTPLEEG